MNNHMYKKINYKIYQICSLKFKKKKLFQKKNKLYIPSNPKKIETNFVPQYYCKIIYFKQTFISFSFNNFKLMVIFVFCLIIK